MLAHSTRPLPPPPPWWRFPIVWFALSGPALVVVAGFVTMAIAYHGADIAIPETALPVAARSAAPSGALAPALQARNHAATPAPASPR